MFGFFHQKRTNITSRKPLEIAILPSALKKDSLYGFVDYQEKEVIPFQFKTIGPFHSNSARVKLEKFGDIDLHGNIIVKPLYDMIQAIPALHGGCEINLTYGKKKFTVNENYIVLKIVMTRSSCKNWVLKLKIQKMTQPKH